MPAIVRTTYAVVLASALIAIGLIWDISWHRSVGRDTFWTAPHLVEYVAAILVATSCGWLILRSTFSAAPTERDRTVRFWGFRGPVGAWVSVWGSLAMLVSAPFDNWWHNAYGLDVKIVSPPHIVLGVGMMGIVLGAMLLALAVQNSHAERDRGFSALFAVASAVLVLTLATMTFEYTGFPNLWRGRLFYLVSAASVPILLAAAARAGRLRWPATATAALFMLFSLALGWALEQVPATPKLAPINNPITHLVAAPFPVALVVPAFTFDLVHRWWGDRRDWRLAGLLGFGFVAALLAVSWPLSGFLLSPAARNPVFLADQWDYSVRLGPWRYEHWDALRGGREILQASGLAVARAVLVAMLLAAISSRIGLWWGNWMRRVKR